MWVGDEILQAHTSKCRHHSHIFLTEYSQRMFFLIDFRQRIFQFSHTERDVLFRHLYRIITI